MKKYFRKQFKYNDWANYRVLITLEKSTEDDDRLATLYSHLISTQIIWLNRIKGLPTSPFPLWEKYKLNELRTMTEENSTNWANYLEEHRFETFEEMIFYKNSKGARHENTIGDIISQVISHGAYHRGQIASLFKEVGLQPPATDYVSYIREGN